MSKAVTQEGKTYRRIHPRAARALYETGTPIWLSMDGMSDENLWLDYYYTNESRPCVGGTFDSIVKSYHEYNAEYGEHVEFYIPC